MADTITRTFWIIPNDNDPKTGKPKEYAQKPSTFVLSGLGLATQPVQVTERMTPDGEYVQTVDGPDGKPVEIDRGVDSKQLALNTARQQESNRAADNARADLPKPPPPQTPDEARLTAAQAASAEAAAAKAVNPPTIERQRANAGLLDTGASATERVSKDQADYDRQAIQDLQARAQQAEATAMAQARLRIEQDRWTGEQAAAEFNRGIDKLRVEVERERNAITARGQDMSDATSRRGQDLSADVARRGQDLGLQGDFMRTAAGLSEALLPSTVPNATLDALHASQNNTRAIGGFAPAPPQPYAPMPYDPIALATRAAQQARYVLPGQQPPPPAPPGPYVMG